MDLDRLLITIEHDLRLIGPCDLPGPLQSPLGKSVEQFRIASQAYHRFRKGFATQARVFHWDFDPGCFSYNGAEPAFVMANYWDTRLDRLYHHSRRAFLQAGEQHHIALADDLHARS